MNSNNSPKTISIEPVDESIIEIIKDFHFDFTIMTFLEKLFIELLVDTVFEPLTLTDGMYDYRKLEVSKDLTINNVIKANMTALIDGSANNLTIRHNGSQYTITGNHKILDLYMSNGLIEATSENQEIISQNQSEIVEITFNPTRERLTKAFTGLAESPLGDWKDATSDTAQLYSLLSDSIPHGRTYFVNKAVNGVESDLRKNTSITKNGAEKLERVIQSNRERWISAFGKPKRLWFDDESFKKGTMFHETLAEFVQFFPDVELMDDVYSDIYYDLGILEEF